MRATTKKLMDSLSANVYYNMLPDKRLVQLTYRGVTCGMPVKSFMEQVEVSIAATLKGTARVAADIPALLVEDELVQLVKLKPKVGQIDEGLLKPWRKVRVKANADLGTEK